MGPSVRCKGEGTAGLLGPPADPRIPSDRTARFRAPPCVPPTLQCTLCPPSHTVALPCATVPHHILVSGIRPVSPPNPNTAAHPSTRVFIPHAVGSPVYTSCPHLVSRLPVHTWGPALHTHTHGPMTSYVPSSCPLTLCLQSASDGFWKSVATRVPKEPPEIRILNPYFIQEAAFTLIGLPFNNGLMGRGVR